MPLVRMPARHVQLVLPSFLLCVLAQGPLSLDLSPNAQYEYTEYATLLHEELFEERTYNSQVPPTSNRITTDSKPKCYATNAAHADRFADFAWWSVDGPIAAAYRAAGDDAHCPQSSRRRDRGNARPAPG